MNFARFVTPDNFVLACICFQAGVLLYSVKVIGRVAASNDRMRSRIASLRREREQETNT